MEIHEYQAKALFREFGVETLDSQVVSQAEELDGFKMPGPYVVKAQVHAGGRGLAGGIKKASDLLTLKKTVREMLGQKLVTAQTGEEGKIIRQVLIEQACEIEKEFYLSFLLDRSAQQIMLLLSPVGGVSIEETAHKTPEKICKIPVDLLTGVLPFQTVWALTSLGLSFSFFKEFHLLLSRLYKLMIETESLMIEINPLVKVKEKPGDKPGPRLMPLDAKMSFDDNSLFRQDRVKALMDLTQMPVEEQKAFAEGLSFVKLSGNIGCLVNGAGLAMATMDIVKLKGAFPANFLDVGGGADSKKIDSAFRILKEDPRVQGILVNIFGGIVKCDLIAEGLLRAIDELNITIPIVVRLEGTNARRAREILTDSGRDLSFADNLEEAAEKIIALTRSGKEGT